MRPGLDGQGEGELLLQSPDQTHQQPATAIETTQDPFGLGLRRLARRLGPLLGGLGVAASNMLQRHLLQARERLVCFALGSHPYRDQGRHCHRQPEPFHSFGLPAATALPVPAASFPVLEATFDPATQPIPARFGLLNRQVSQDEPGILIAFLPARKPRATHPRPKARKSSAPARSIVCLCVAPSA